MLVLLDFVQVDATKRGGIARFINHSCEVLVVVIFLIECGFLYAKCGNKQHSTFLLFIIIGCLTLNVGSLIAIPKSYLLRVRRRFSFMQNVIYLLVKKLHTIINFPWRRIKFPVTVAPKSKIMRLHISLIIWLSHSISCCLLATSFKTCLLKKYINFVCFDLADVVDH